MQTPKKTEMEFRKIKILKGGGDGIDLEYSYLFSVQGRTFIKKRNEHNDLPAHDDLIQLIKRLRPIVTKVINLDYARDLISAPGFEPTEQQQQMAEGLVQNVMGQIEPTGVIITKKKEGKAVVISYTKEDSQEKVTRHATALINLEDYQYEIEDDLKDIISDLELEAFRYQYEEKYADFEQLTLDMDDVNIEEAQEVD